MRNFLRGARDDNHVLASLPRLSFHAAQRVVHNSETRGARYDTALNFVKARDTRVIAFFSWLALSLTYSLTHHTNK